MQTVSQDFLAEGQKPLMGAAAVEITLTVADVQATAAARAESSDQSPWSDPGLPLHRGGAAGPGLATFEPGRMKADGALVIGPASGAEGYVSRSLSGADGSFVSPPRLLLRFSAPAAVPALTLDFDRAAGEWCSRIAVTAWKGQAQVFRRDYQPTAVHLETPDPIRDFDSLAIDFLATEKPRRRARLAALTLGRSLVFGPGQVSAASVKTAADPIGRRLPGGKLDWQIINIGPESGLYDPDDPAGLWQYTEQRSPITLRLAQRITGRAARTEWLPGGEFYLTGRPRAENLTVSFEATDAIGLLDGVFEKGRFSEAPRSLYDLAEEVLLASDLARLWPGQQPWSLWEGLRNCFTAAPLPARSARECLQLIAHAARCTLFCDRQGRVCIRPQPEAETGLSLPLARQLGRGVSVQKNPALSRVDCLAYRYTPGTETQLHRGEYPVNGSRTLRLTYRAAAKVKALCTGAKLTKAEYYLTFCLLELSGSGTASVTLTGCPLESSTLTVSCPGPAPEGSGQAETVDNPLITDPDAARLTAAWVRDELCRRTVYRCRTRGEMQLDPLDLLRLDSHHAADVPVRLLENRLEFSGGSLAGELVLKNTRGETAVRSMAAERKGDPHVADPEA